MNRKMKLLITILFCLTIVVLNTTIFVSATENQAIMPRGYENATCGTMIPKYNMSTYNDDNLKHDYATNCVRTSLKAKTSIPTASTTSCYVVTSVYKDNGTKVGVYYDSDVVSPSSKWNLSITATVNISSQIDVRCVNHYAYLPATCDNGEHVYYYYDVPHSSDP